MSISLRIAFASLAAGTLLAASTAHGQFATTLKFSGVSRPTVVTYAPGDPDRLFVCEKAGYIEIYNLATESLNSDHFLNIDSIVTGGTSNSNEQGLLGLAFHPNYEQNGYFYVYYTATAGSGDATIRRYSRNGSDPDHATTSGAMTLLSFDEPYSNHNGGWLGFGPDGYLYIATGDGGSAGDPGNRAQDITNQRLGKMLRIDVDNGSPYSIPADNPFVGVTGDDEIWAYGLRNPWRCAFDAESGDLWIADVGQNAREEVNYQSAGAAGGRNYGWKCMEANNCYSSSGGCSCGSSSYTDPVFDYAHNSAGGYSVTGGEVYRGCAMPGEAGTYFCADYVIGNIWKMVPNGSGGFTTTNIRSQLSPSIEGTTISSISNFGTDFYGEVYIASHSTGRIFKIISDAEGEIDCNFEPPVNDDCSGAIAVSDGTTAFTTIDAADSGYDVPLTCSITGGPALLADTWYSYTASCTGMATISTCGSSDFNDRFAIYSVAGGCPDSTSSVYACADDTCGTSAFVEFLAIEGQTFKIRIGSVDGSTGSGSMLIGCVPFGGGGCDEDLNGDGEVDGADLGLMLAGWGTPDADLNGDGATDGADLGLLLAAFGGDC